LHAVTGPTSLEGRDTLNFNFWSRSTVSGAGPQHGTHLSTLAAVHLTGDGAGRQHAKWFRTALLRHPSTYTVYGPSVDVRETTPVLAVFVSRCRHYDQKSRRRGHCVRQPVLKLFPGRSAAHEAVKN